MMMNRMDAIAAAKDYAMVSGMATDVKAVVDGDFWKVNFEDEHMIYECWVEICGGDVLGFMAEPIPEADEIAAAEGMRLAA